MKKIISFLMAFVMIVSVVPVHTVQADDIDAVSTGKTYVDAIVSEVPTVEEYTSDTYSEELAENIVKLADLLSSGDLVSGEISELDTYVAEKTTPAGDTTPVYSTVQDFSDAYSTKQESVLGDKAQQLYDLIDDFLAEKLSKAQYNVILPLYEDSYVNEVYTSTINDQYNNHEHFGQIVGLMELIKDAENTIDKIPALSSEKVYKQNFNTAMERVDDACQTVDAQYKELLKSEFYFNCLGSYTNSGELIDNYSDFEKAYYQVGTFTVMTDDIKAKVKTLSEAVDELNADTDLSVYSLFNSREINTLLGQYKKVVEFEEKAMALAENLTNLTQISEALKVYESYYKELDEETKTMVPESYVERVLSAVRVSTGAEEIEEKIDGIGVVESEENYKEVEGLFEDAYTAYQTFIVRYQGIRGVADMISNASVLDDESSVLSLIKSIQELLEMDEITLSSKLPQMESIHYAYSNLRSDLKPQVYNIDDFNEMYQDVQEAQGVISSIASIQNSFTLEDQEYINQVKESYNNLSERAKTYVGASRYTALNTAEQQLMALNQNVAARTTALISQIGTVTAASKDAIQNARASYNSLNTLQRSMVTNYSLLTAAESEYGKLDTTIAKATVEGLGTYSFSGQAIRPAIEVKLNGVTLVQGVDYTVNYSANVNVGTAKMILTGIHNYTGSLTKTFTIQPASLTLADVKGYKSSYSYTAKKIKPGVTVTLGNKKLVKGTDYSVKYTSNKQAGTATITIKGIDNYTGTIKRYFKIKKVSIKKAKVTGLAKRYYRTGKKIKPSITVKWKGKKLKENRDYKVILANNRYVGTATMKVKGIGSFKKSKSFTFKIY